jgi:hypothetical protein
MKLLRTIRLDPSDTFVFDKAAEPGEWAVSGTFMFWKRDPALLEGKARSALRSGFLGVDSLGWSTLVQIVEASEEAQREAVETLARHLVTKFGAPTMREATLAAAEEFAFAASLCDHPVDTLVAVHRTAKEDGIHEAFRTLRPRAGKKPARAFSFFETDDEADEPAETLDIVGMAERERK